MKRLAVLAVLALPLFAATERWAESYDRGVKAVNKRDYGLAAKELESAIAAMPAENTALRAGNKIITYVPHFWLGIARFNLGDIDGALAEWKTSEEQRAIQQTDYHPTLRGWVSRAQSEKVRIAKDAAADSRRAADAALSRALTAQAEALSNGHDRTDSYRRGQRRLQEALAQFNGAASDARAYGRAATIAAEAMELFAKAGQEKGRPAVVPARGAPLPSPAPVVTPAVVATETAPPVVPPVDPDAERKRRELAAAYRAFARGELDIAEQLLDAMLVNWRSAEAYLLRGCTRYTRALLAGSTDTRRAASDIKLALLLNPKLTLDRESFSPKLVAFFEQVRREG